MVLILWINLHAFPRKLYMLHYNKFVLTMIIYIFLRLQKSNFIPNHFKVKDKQNKHENLVKNNKKITEIIENN